MDKTKPFTITKEQVWRAYNKVRRKGEGTGVDNQTWETFDAKRIQTSVQAVEPDDLREAI